MRKAVYSFIIIGLLLMLYRAFAGLGAVTALSDYQPWGLVKAVNIFFAATLAAGSFVVAAAAEVFGARRFRPLVRPVLLMGFICHTFVLIALLYDVGRPLDVWRIITNPHGTSALLWTAWTEVAYTSVMVVELLPEVLHGRAGLVSTIEKVKVPLVVLSAALAVVYQSTLGTLFLASPQHIVPAWSGPWLNWLFLLSAVPAGLGMVVIESSISGRYGRRSADPVVLRQAGGMMGVFLVLYMLIRLTDLVIRGAFTGGSRLGDVWLVTELCVGGLLPLVLLLVKRVRETGAGLVAASALTLLGVFMNRVGVTIIGWVLPPGASYFPSALEFIASAFFIVAAVSLYWYASGRLALKAYHLPETQPLD